MNTTIISNDNINLSCDLPSTCMNCILQNIHKGYAHIKCPENGQSKRVGYLKNTQGEIYACSENSKTTDLFKSELNVMASHIKSLRNKYDGLKEIIRTEEKNSLNLLLHNLESINTHNIRVFESFLPETLFTSNIQSTLTITENAITKSPRKAAVSFLTLLKLNSGLKAEFSVYRLLRNNNPQLNSIRRYSLHRLFMSLAYRFIGDFEAKNVELQINNYHDSVTFDFDTIFLGLYYIFDNAVKYTQPYTKCIVDFHNTQKSHIVEFTMSSVHVLASERDKIMKEGISGINARNAKINGTGLGMFYANKMFQLNNVELIPIFGNDIEIDNDIEYSENVFKLIFPK